MHRSETETHCPYKICQQSVPNYTYFCSKGKKRKRIYIALFIYYVYLKALRHGSHSFTHANTPCLPSTIHYILRPHLLHPDFGAVLFWNAAKSLENDKSRTKANITVDFYRKMHVYRTQTVKRCNLDIAICRSVYNSLCAHLTSVKRSSSWKMFSSMKLRMARCIQTTKAES